jgi:hypothetical protein
VKYQGTVITAYGLNYSSGAFLSILSIKCGNWFYRVDGAETAETAEIREFPLFTAICAYVA